jgi:putative FmdB family regulatory protein
MPTYNYYCEKCQQEFELKHSMLDDKPKECPNCLATLKKKINKTDIIFVSGGFYKSDNKK